MPKINYDNEKFFLDLVTQGKLVITKEGTAFNTKTKNYIGSVPSKFSGYKSIGWKDNKISRKILLHRLVFLVHGGILTPDFPLVNHIDGNKQNNNFDNLEKSNYSHNNKHAIDTGLYVFKNSTKEKLLDRQSGENAYSAKLTNEQSDEIRNLYATGNYTQRELGLMFGVCHPNINKIINNKRYIRHINNA